jgi:hypothetical protein
MLAERAVMAIDRDTVLSRIPVPALAPLLAAAFAIGQPVLANLLGITRWDQCYCDSRHGAWGLGLTLLVWYTAIAVPAGVLLARRIVGRTGVPRFMEYVTEIGPAALGTLLATPVVVVLALPAQVTGVRFPGIEAGFSVSIGAALGAVAAAGAMASVAVVRGLLASWLWIWASGVLAAVVLLFADARGSQPLGGVAVLFSGNGWAQEVARDVGVLIAIVGPAIVAAAAAIRSTRRGTGAAMAALGSASGAALIVAAYRSRPAAVFADNRTWYVLVILQLLLAVLAGAVTVAITRSAQRHAVPDPEQVPR